MTTQNAAQVLQVGFTVSGAEAGSGIHAIVAPHSVAPHSVAPRATLRPTSRGKIIGGDERVRHVLSTLDRVARSNCTVLVTGESGTGKELAVAALHDASPRKAGPFVAVNCGAIPAELVESELFGHAKGAFTGAATARRGLVAAAEGGTLFLDEIGELPLATQVKLLRLFQNREYTPVGETRPVKCDVRIVAATHRNLEEEVTAGRFREDLYFRLNVIHVHLPSLRERNQDVSVLAKHFLKVCAEKVGSQVTEFSDEALALIQSDEWTGNVRALENAIEHAVLMAPGARVEVADLPERLRRKRASESPSAVTVAAEAQSSTLPEEGIDLFAAIEHYENNLIRQALARTGGNKNRAAQLLNLNRTTLVEMIKRKKLG